MTNEEILKLIIEDYKKINEIDAIALGGSSTNNTNDNKSDFDIYIYSEKEPPINIRHSIAEKYASHLEIDNHYFETGDTYILKETQKPFDIMYRTPKSIEGNFNWVWENHNASLGYTTCFIFNVATSKILFDKNGWYKRLQEKALEPYPDKLAKNIITKNFNYLKKAMFSYYDQLEFAIKRNDFVSINHRTSAFLASYFDIIFALNKTLHPGEKKLISYAINHCKILPKDFEHLVNNFAIGAISEKLETANQLIDNIKILL